MSEKISKCIKKEVSDRKRFSVGNINSLCNVNRLKTMKSHGNNLDVALIRMVTVDWNKVERFGKKIETSERRCCRARSSPSPTSFRNEAIPQLLGIVSSQLIAYLEIAFQKRATSPKVMTCSVVNLHPMNGQCRIVQSWIFVTHK